MSNSNVVKCPKCNKVFFDVGSDICPFCKCNVHEQSIDTFKNMFGEDNPFNDIFGGNL